MTAPSKKRFGVGVREVRIFALNASGTPNASGITAYEGLKAAGAKVLDIADPAYRTISHTGDDTLMQLDSLPPLEGMTGTLRVAQVNDDLDAALSGLTAFTVGEMNMLLGGVNDKSGFEPVVALHAWRQALDEAGNRVWESRLFPRVTLAKQESGFNDNPEERVYGLTPGIVTKHLWGTALALGVEGSTRSQVIRAVSQYKPKVVAWLGDGTTAVFPFPTDYQAQAVGKITVWVNDVLKTTNITKATTGLTFTASYEPALNARIVALYEYA